MATAQLALAGLQSPAVAVKTPAQQLTVSFQPGPVFDGLQQIGVRRAPRIDYKFTRNIDGGDNRGADLRFPVEHLLAGDQPRRAYAVAMSIAQNLLEHIGFLLVPGEQQRATLQQRQVQALPNLQILGVALGNTELLLRSGWGRIEAGMQDGAVRLARPVQGIGGFFDDQDPRAFQREAARHRAADHASADDDNVKKVVANSHRIASLRKSYRPESPGREAKE